MAESVETLNIRVGIVESEVEGEKAVTRYTLTQIRLNTEELIAFRSEAGLRLDRMVGDMALVKAAQIAQGGTLNILVQDVRGLRTEMGAMRAEVRTEMDAMRAEVRTEMDAMRAEVRTEMGAMRAEVRTEMGAVRTEMDELRTEMRTEIGAVRTEMGELRTEMTRRLGTIEQHLATLVAAVSPCNPA
jgi:HAMP domain-containing protein